MTDRDWQGALALYDFGAGAGALRILLDPDAPALAALSPARRKRALTEHRRALSRLTAKGAVMTVVTNLARGARGAPARVSLAPEQAERVVALLRELVAYLAGEAPAPPAERVALDVPVTGGSPLPPAFEIDVRLGTEDGRASRAMEPPERWPRALPTVVAALAGGGAAAPVATFAAAFKAAFPGLTLAIGDGGGAEPGARGLWAVQSSLLRIEVGTGAGPRYLAPRPLATGFHAVDVALPELPPAAAPDALPDRIHFTGLDADELARRLFPAVDRFLASAPPPDDRSAAAGARAAVAASRRRLAERYAGQVDWLFPDSAPFTGSAAQLGAARAALAERLRSELAIGYATRTLVQYDVRWPESLPDGSGDGWVLHGRVRPATSGPPSGWTVAAGPVAVTAAGSSPLTLLVGAEDEERETTLRLDLELEVTHVERLAPPSGRLELIGPAPSAAAHVGPRGAGTVVPLVLRRCPEPPTLLSQRAVAGADGGVPDHAGPLEAAAAWRLRLGYETRPTPHDRVVLGIAYGGPDAGAEASSGEDAAGSLRSPLVRALARFGAAHEVLAPVLDDRAHPAWGEAAAAFAALVGEVADEGAWAPASSPPPPSAPGTDAYTITDLPGEGGERLLTLTRDRPSGVAGASAVPRAVAPGTGTPYPDQTATALPYGVAVRYAPLPPEPDGRVGHEIEVGGLDAVAIDRAASGLRLERNRVRMGADGVEWTARDGFVYRTPLVRWPEPVTPLIDIDTPIDLAALPPAPGPSWNPDAGSPPGTASVGRRLHALLHALLGGDAARAGAPPSARRISVACAFRHAVAGRPSTAGLEVTLPVFLLPVVEVDPTAPGAVAEMAYGLASSATGWVARLAPPLVGPARFVFDVSVHPRAGGAALPTLRLRTLELAWKDVAPEA